MAKLAGSEHRRGTGMSLVESYLFGMTSFVLLVCNTFKPSPLLCEPRLDGCAEVRAR